MRFAGNRIGRAAVLALVAAPFALTGDAAHAVPVTTAPQEAAGFAALRTGAYDDAVQALRARALEGNAAALRGWVTALRETGDYDGAVSAAGQGVERGVAGARALLGAALMGGGGGGGAGGGRGG
ncbi:MAG: hypothetical protein OXF01_07820, partial [Gemmatimonadetes bacterium]|nr:hypothetical protein [Gemmatimonadota bacterium]